MHASPSQMMKALRRPVAVWLALCIALLGALVPTLSHALVWARGDAAPVEICTTTGQRWVALTPQAAASEAGVTSDSAATGAPASTQMLIDCPFCLLFADRAAPPPPVSMPSCAVPGLVVAPVTRPTCLAPSVFAFAPLPRGPPASLIF